MESSEPESTEVSNSNDNPELGFRSASSFPSSNHASETSDLNHQAEVDALHEEFQSKLILKDKDEQSEIVDKDGKLDGGEEMCHKHGAGESYEVDGWGEYNDNWNGIEDNNWTTNVNGNGNDEEGGDYDLAVHEEERKEERSGGSNHQYPVRPEAEDCAFYLKTGTCKFGFNCKFNHPVTRRKNQAGKEKAGEREESADRLAQAECKYYLSSGGCKFGKACKYNHSRGTCSVATVLELNFLGLPIRLGEKECPYYMRTGSCKFGANCKFNHPDPTAVGGGDLAARYVNGGSISLQGVSQPSLPSWSSPRTLNETTAFMPMMLSPTQGVSPQSSEWNVYQAPVYLPEGSMRPPSAYVMNNPAIEKTIYMHHQKKTQVEEFPERPGEPECSYFLKTGDCKFKSNCKFHHPRNRITKLPSTCALSDKGLPLRPDQNVCTHYSRYGICKFGPACKFDHPINPSPSTGSPFDQQSSYSDSARVEVAENGGATGQIMQ
ncbi:zinc finger CCCH domain-containing protein 67-like [Prosopis cineraria]|uniref:zinc finger CCCH domain-containing protein 67-like n=1 Tax=Prosopis cineraria TaxID=364024 RepID=UPI00240FF512|nr:zinc finger CCCH domain-containing protein 67-like [Prosopis cineraria]